MYSACTRNTETNLILVFMVSLSFSLYLSLSLFGRKQRHRLAWLAPPLKKRKEKEKKRRKIRRKENRGTDGTKYSQNLHDENF